MCFSVFKCVCTEVAAVSKVDFITWQVILTLEKSHTVLVLRLKSTSVKMVIYGIMFAANCNYWHPGYLSIVNAQLLSMR